MNSDNTMDCKTRAGATKRPERLNLLFLGGAKRVGMARLFVKAGAERGLEVSVFGYELDRRVPLALVGEVVEGLRWSDPGLFDHLHEVVGRHEIDIIVPFVDPAVEIAAAYAARYGDVYAAAGGAALARVMFDKVEADRLFRRLGIDVPPGVHDGACFPLIAKPRNGSASRGIVVLRDAGELAALESPGDYLIQQYVEGATEYSVDCFVDAAGRMCGAVPRRRVEVIGGEVSVSRTERIQALTDIVGEIVAKTGLRGPLTLQFLREPASGRFLLMEINPRLGGGAVCSVHAGLPLPGWIIDEALGMVCTPVDNWVDGAMMTRCFEEAVFAPGGEML